MNLIRSRGFKQVLLFIALCTGVVAAQTADKKEIVKQARQSYYSLKNQGLAEFQCAILPDWRLLLTEQKLAPADVDRGVLLLDKIHFSVSVAASGEARVTHNDVAVENKQVAEGLSQVYTGMEQMTTGFFQTWSVFTISPALPEVGGDYRLEKAGTDYSLSYNDGTADIVTLLDRDFVMSSLKTKTSEFDSTIKPQFKKTTQGLLMTGYAATYTGKTSADTTELQVAIDYQLVDKLQLPQKLVLKGTYGGSPFHVEVAFSGCHATLR